MHPRCWRPVTWMRSSSASKLQVVNIVGSLYHKLWTQSSAPEDGRNHRPKHVEMIGIIKKPLLLHLVGCLYYLYQWCTVKQVSNQLKFISSNFGIFKPTMNLCTVCFSQDTCCPSKHFFICWQYLPECYFLIDVWPFAVQGLLSPALSLSNL